VTATITISNGNAMTAPTFAYVSVSPIPSGMGF
jgi:hypothetical protein